MTQEQIKYAIETGQYPRYIYRYLSLNENNIKSLRERYLWLSNLRDFNDPYEGNIRIDRNYRKEEIDAFCYLRKDIATQEDITAIYANPISFFDNAMDRLSANEKFCCFSTINNNILMWAHYANKHTGICLEFDLLKDEDETLTRTLLPVRYTNVNKSYNYVHNPDGYLLRLLFTKSLDWAYEHEYRLAKSGLDGNKLHFNLQALSSVIFGCRTTLENKQVVKSILNNNVEYKQCVMNQYAFKLDIEHYTWRT